MTNWRQEQLDWIEDRGGKNVGHCHIGADFRPSHGPRSVNLPKSVITFLILFLIFFFHKIIINSYYFQPVASFRNLWFVTLVVIFRTPTHLVACFSSWPMLFRFLHSWLCLRDSPKLLLVGSPFVAFT